jgi:hypothetical protein
MEGYSLVDIYPMRPVSRDGGLPLEGSRGSRAATDGRISPDYADAFQTGTTGTGDIPVK